MNKSGLRWLSFLLAVSPAIMPIVLMVCYATNMPWWDEWDPDMAGMYIKAHQHRLTFADLAAQHNEHRVLLPRVLSLVVSTITHGNQFALMLCGWLVAGLTSVGILWLICRTIPDATPPPARFSLPASRILLLWFLCNLLVFSPVQWENWIWGMGLANLMPMLFVTAAIIVAGSHLKPWPKVALVILLCSAATYSSGNGVLSWALAGMLLAWSGSFSELKSKIWVLNALGCAFILNVLLYFVGYTRPVHAVDHPYSGSIVQMIHFWLTFVGNPFASVTAYSPTLISTIAGASMLALLAAIKAYFVYVWRWRNDQVLCGRMLVWFAVAGYAVISGAMGALARIGFGVDLAITARYVSYSIYLPLALIPLTVLVCDDLRRNFVSAGGTGESDGGIRPIIAWLAAHSPAIMAVAMIQFQLFSLHAVIAGCETWQYFIARARGALLLVNVLPDNPQLSTHVNAKGAVVVEQAPILNEMGYLHPPLIQSSNAALIQAPADAGVVRGKLEKIWKTAPGQIACSGWAIFPDRRRPADAVFLTYDNEKSQPIIFATAGPDVEREDLAKDLGDPSFGGGGWIAIFGADKLPANQQIITVRAWALDTQTGRTCKLDEVMTIGR